MSYLVMVPGKHGFHGFGETATPAAVPVLTTPQPMPAGLKAALVIGGTVLLGVVVYSTYKRAQVMQLIAEKEGSAGLLKYSAGEAAIGLGSRAGRRLIDEDGR